MTHNQGIAFDVTRKIAIRSTRWQVKFLGPDKKWKLQETTYCTRCQAQKAARKYKKAVVSKIEGWQIKSHTRKEVDGTWYVYPKLYQSKAEAQQRIRQMMIYRD